MNKKYRLLCIVMALSLLLCLCACGGGQSVDGNATSGQEIAGTDGAQDTQDVDNPEEPEDAEEEEPLPVIECRSLPAFTNNFNPFTATGDDAEAVGLVYSTLADSACRTVVPSEDGGYLVTYEIYDGVRFSDGRQMTADDVIYTLNIICDPMYTFAHPDGPARVIYGTDEYQTGYTPVYTYILSDLQNGVAPDGTYYTQEDSDLFAQALRDAGIRFVNEIIDYCAEQYADEKSMGALGVDARTVRDNEGYRTAFAMWCWQFASGLNNDGLFSTLGGGEYDLSVSGPTPADFWQAIFTTYGYDMSDQGINYEKKGDGIETLLRQTIVDGYPQLYRCVPTDESAESVSGIVKVDENTVTVHVSDLADAPNNVYIVPAGFYGELTKGDIGPVLAGTDVMGSGRYTLASSNGAIATLEKSGSYTVVEGGADTLLIIGR